jgi:hypothetical protein
MTTTTRTKPTTKNAKATREHRAPARPVGPAATERAEAAAAELVELLQAHGVKFAAPDKAPAQIAASILAAWKLAAEGPRDSDADYLLAVSGAVDGLAHALTSSAPRAALAASILSPAKATGGRKGGAR